MIFKTLVLTGLLASFSQSFSFAADSFRVAPYTLKHTNGNLLLNFQTNQNESLVIDDNGENKAAAEYKKNKHYQIELSPAPCGTMKEIQIIHTVSRNILYKKTWAASPCSSLENNDSFVFGFISDTQQYRDRHEDIAKIIAHHHSLEPIQFLINGGDVVQEGAEEGEWINYFLGGQAYLQDIPQIAAIGNHDYRGSKGSGVPKFFKQFMRWEGADKLGNLFFDLPEMQVLILNSNFSKFDEAESRAVWTWVEEKMSRARRLNKPLIVATHFPVYSSSLNKFISTSVITMKKKLVPLVEKYKVPLVLSGHTHMYERSYKDGITYLVAGPAGGRANKATFKNKYMKVFDQDSLTFTKIRLARRIFTIETYNQDNKMIDHLIIKLK